MNIETITEVHPEDPTWEKTWVMLEFCCIGSVSLPKKATRQEKAHAIQSFVEDHRKNAGLLPRSYGK